MGFRYFATSVFAAFALPFGLVSFTSQPAATDLGDSVRIAFAVSEYTDVSVEILDGSGNIVRHLVSGKLGFNPPAPLAANSPSQTIFWDKKDDYGKAFIAAYDVRVGLALRADFDKILGWQGQNHMSFNGPVTGLAVDTLGNIYVATASTWRGQVNVTAMDRSGAYLRTLYPYPGDQPWEKTKGFGQIQKPDGRGMPVVFLGHIGVMLQEFSGLPRQGMAVSPQGWLVMANSVFTMYSMKAEGRRALIMATDGTCPRDTIFGPRILPAKNNNGSLMFAVSTDGNTLFASGLSTVHAVLKSPLNSTTNATVFAGIPGTLGADSGHFNDPHGLDVDDAGRVYVADYMNNRVVILDSNAAFLNSIPVDRPDQVKVNRKNGDIFVMSLDTAKTYYKLIKFHGLPGLDSAASVTVTYDVILGMARCPLMALDFRAPAPLVYLTPSRYGVANELVVVQDNGATLATLPGRLGTKTANKWMGSTMNAPGYLAVDPAERALLAGCGSWSKVDLATDAVSNTAIKGCEIGFDRKGRIWAQGPGGYVDSTFWMYDINGTRLNFPGGANTWAGPGAYAWGPEIGTRGFAFAKDNAVLVFHARNPRAGVTDTTLLNYNRVTTYDTNLNLIDTMLIALPPSSGGIGVDLNGSIFLGYNVRPKGVFYPDFCVGPYFPNPLAQTSPWYQAWDYGYLNYYLHQIGSLLKFPPSGGHVRMASVARTSVPMDSLTDASGMPRVPPVQIAGIYHYYTLVQGPEWQWFGLTPSPASENQGDPSCQCFTSRFSVDEFGRVFAPEAFRFSVAVLDNNRNELLRFGEYGNADQQGAGSSRPDPAIPFTFPSYVYKANNHVYVSDVGSQRVVRVRLSYSVWATSSGQSPVETAKAPLFSGLSVYPIPANPGVSMEFTLAGYAPVRLAVYSADGKLVRNFGNTRMVPGMHRVKWDGRDAGKRPVAAGLYIARLTVAGRTYNRSLVLVK